MRVVQLHPVEARLAGAHGRGGKQRRQGLRQRGDVRQLEVRDALARPHGQRFPVARAQDRAKLIVGERGEPRSNLSIGRFRHAERAAMIRRDRQKSLEKLPRIGTPAHRQKIDELNEEARLAGARAPHRLDQTGQPRDEPIIADAQQRPARHLPDARGLDHDGARPASGEALVPVEHLRSDQPVLGGPPRDHGGHPGALPEHEAANAHGLK